MNLFLYFLTSVLSSKIDMFSEDNEEVMRFLADTAWLHSVRRENSRRLIGRKCLYGAIASRSSPVA